MVTVCCSIPQGLVLKLYEAYQAPEISPLGDRTRTYTAYRPIEGAEIVLNGPGIANDMTPLKVRQQPDFTIVWPYALTLVPSDFWNRWHKDNKDTDMVRNRQIFAFKAENDAKSAARELEREPTGLSEIDPDQPGKRADGTEIRELSGLKVKVEKGDTPQ
jgi:hypothetical protein